MLVLFATHNDDHANAVELRSNWDGCLVPIVEAFVGERVAITVADWRSGDMPARVRPRSVKLIAETDTCHACGHAVEPKLSGEVDGNAFVGRKVGRYRLEVSGGPQRPALLEVAVLPREALNAHGIAAPLSGINMGRPRSVPARRAVLRNIVRDVGHSGALTELTPKHPLPVGLGFNLYGG